MQEDQRSAGFPSGHPEMTSLLGVPVTSKGTVIGNLYLTDKEDGDFTEIDEEMVQTFAANAAVAIENRQMQARMRALAVLQERDRIGMDLHDGIIQSIYAVGLGLEAVTEDVEERPAEARKGIEAAFERLNAVIRDVRSYIFKLQPANAKDDLRASLLDLVADFRVNSLIETTTQIAPEVPGLGESQRLAIYHVAHEALANVRRHARASAVTLSLDAADGAVRLRVSDNGDGFDRSIPPAEQHRGLRNMKSRAEGVGGKLNIATQPGSGTTVEFEVPVEKKVA
jgi:signal transduction histidine kinase